MPLLLDIVHWTRSRAVIVSIQPIQTREKALFQNRQALKQKHSLHLLIHFFGKVSLYRELFLFFYILGSDRIF